MTGDKIPIGTFSYITHLSQKALRIYDEKGLLVPSERDLCTGYRYYSYSQIENGIFLRNLVWLGFSLSEIEVLLDARKCGDGEAVREIFSLRLGKVRDEILRLSSVENVLGNYDLLSGGLCMSVTEPKIEIIPELRVISRRKKGVYQETIPELCRELLTYVCADEGCEPAAHMAGPVIFICHDEEFRETDADIEVAIPVAGRVTIEYPAVEVRNLEGGEFAAVVHTGPYQGVSTAYERLFAYLESENLVPAGPLRELYINDPAEVPEEELLTEVMIPVRKG